VGEIVTRLRDSLAKRGARGIVGLGRKFRIMDDDGSKSLSLSEFKKGLQECALDISHQEATSLFQWFDRDRNGSLDYEEFLQGLKGPLNARRKKFIDMAFAILDKDGNGAIEPQELVGTYDASKHPDVLSGEKTQNEVLMDFLDTFDVGDNKDGKVTAEEFQNYYHTIGISIDNDDYFELMMRNCWHISGGEGWCANTANKRVLVTHADGSQTVEEVKNDLGVREGDKAGYATRLQQQGLNVGMGQLSLKDSLDTTAQKYTSTPSYTASKGTPDPQLSQQLRIAKAGGMPNPTTKAASALPKVHAAMKEASPGVASLIIKLKQELKSRGASGMAGLGRKFRIMDDDGSKTLNLAEFKKAMREMNLSLNDQDLRILFGHFDADGSGTIGFEEFIQAIRDPLNERRLELVRRAFSILDKDSSGVIEPEEIMEAYDASQHPEVLQGKKTAQQVLMEFMENFEVGETVDGMITLQEFENYYTSIGANIPDDDYFELMMRNCWHISGGQGWCANSANKRVLVTHADGTQSVQEIQNDLGLKAGDKEGALKRLHQQGSDAQSISFADAIDNKKGHTQQKKASSLAAHMGRPQTAPAAPFAHEGNVQPELALSQHAPISQHRQAWENRHQEVGTVGAQADICNAAAPGIQILIKRLRAELAQRGARGIVGMSRRFRIMDDDGNHSLNLQEFKKAMQELGLGLTDQEMRLLFTFFDSDGSGSVDYEEFLRGLRGPMNERRLALVRTAFTRLDKNGNGIVEPEELVDVYDASAHPEVIAGRMTSEEVLREFLDTFDVGGEKDGKVTLDEFQNYYHNISMSIDNDDYFELMMRNVWHISGGEGWCANTSNRRVLVTHADGRTTVEEIKDDLGVKATDSAAMQSNLQRQGIQATALGLTWGNEEAKVKIGKKTASIHNRHSADAGVMPGTVAPKPSAQPALSLAQVKAMPASKTAPAGLLAILAKLKAQLVARGARGIIGLSRKFRIMDDDDNKSLSLAEFKKALKEMALDLSDQDLRLLFDHFDRDSNGSLDYEEFLSGVREPMNGRRRGLVEQAFHVLDTDRSGYIEPHEVAAKYDAGAHPDVKAGKKTKEEVYAEFLDTFDVGGDKDGRVSIQEFMNYYQNVSNSIDNDDFFELMIRNCWHISGGEGWCANTSNKRVLVTHVDGRQTVEEIQDDLGLNDGDKEGALRRLRAQGVHAADLSFFGGTESKEGKGKAAPLAALAKQHLAKRNPASIQHSAGVSLGANVRRNPINGSIIQDEDISAKAAAKPRRRQKLAEPTAGLIKILENLKAQLAARGARGMVGLGRKFKIMDDDGSKSLDLLEFKKAMQEMALELTDAEMRAIFGHFDADSSGSIDYEEFIQGVRDPLNNRRLELVGLAFKQIDKDGNGVIEPHEVARKYDASKHPEVIAQRKTPEEVFEEFLDTFDVGGEKDGKVTLAEFQNYYTNVGASIENDDYFELMIRNCWHISGGQGWCENSSNLRVLVTHADGRQSVQELKDDLGLKSGDTQEILRRLRLQGVHDAVGVSAKGNVEEKTDPGGVGRGAVDLESMGVAAGSRSSALSTLRYRKKASETNPSLSSNVVLAADPKDYDTKFSSFAGPTFQRKQNVRAVNPSLTSALGTGFTVERAEQEILHKKPVDVGQSAFDSHITVGFQVDKNVEHQQATNSTPVKSTGPRSLADLAGRGNVSTLLASLKQKLAARGVRGIVGLARRFKIMDDDGSNTICLSEFRKAMRECALDLSDDEIRQLFQHFDKDQSGSVDYDEFLLGLRGSLNPRRRGLVQLVFSRLDKNGNGIVEPEEILDKYDATQHPDVKAGRRSANEVLQEFLDTFDVGGEVDGKVTANEFENYYNNISASIDEDDYFELMIRNAWHVSGGEGWCANTSNRRVLITQPDGSQKVVEVKDDIGIRADDQAAINQNLKKQGFNASSVSLAWSNDDGKGKNSSTLQDSSANKNMFVSPTYRSNIF